MDMTLSTGHAPFEAMRHAMVASQLRTSAVSDAAVVAAMRDIPREAFVPEGVRAVAYRDTALPIGGGRVLNRPLVTGRLLTGAVIGMGDHVLIVGAATGYCAAIAARLAKSVVALESDPALVQHARGVLADKANVTLVTGPLGDGWADGAPYDVILVDGAVEQFPEKLAAQARSGGRIVSGIVDRGVVRLAYAERATGALVLRPFADLDCGMLPGFDAPKPFRF